MAARLDSNFERAIELLYNMNGRAIISGMGKSGLVGRKIAATLSSTGTPSFFMHPAEGIHGDIGMVLSGDVAIVISKSGDTDEIMRLIPMFKRLEVPIIGITGGLDSPLSRQADVVLDTSVEAEACSLDIVPTSSATAALVMGDAMASALLDLRGFTVDDFAFIHPGGVLGRRLIKVSELMHTGEELPVVSHKAEFRKIIMEMTKKKFGLSIVVDDKGKLIGVFTDGDLRRTVQLNDNFLNLKAGDMASRNPKRISPDELGATAVALMEDFKITSLVITDKEDRPIGLIHLHDLLKAKVV